MLKGRLLTIGVCVLFTTAAGIGSQACAAALSQPPVCSTRHVLPGDTDFDFDDKAALAAAWERTGKGCEAFIDPRGRRHLFFFLDIAPSRTDWPAGQIKLRPINLGGYEFQTDVYNNRYIPPVLELQPGDILHVRAAVCLQGAGGQKQSHMHDVSAAADDGTQDARKICEELGISDPGGAANIHTHGMIVSPRNGIRGRRDPNGPGDSMLPVIHSGRYLNYTITVPDELPRSTLLETHPASGEPIVHPGGIYWYHPHIHGSAAEQVTSGMSGFISVGDPFQLMVPLLAQAGEKLEPWRLDRWREEQRARTDVRYVALRDVQLEPTPGGKSGGDAVPGYRKLEKPDPALCGDWRRVNGNTDGGWALQQDATHHRFPGGCSAGGKVWLFPVNDKLYPDIEVGEDRDLFLRLANQSANVTYRISIRSGFEPAKPNAHEVPGKALGFQVIGIDGVVAGAGGPSTQEGMDAVKSQELTEIVMMPAARADILIRNGFASQYRGEHFELVTRQMDMSGTVGPDGAPTADVWPDIALASVRLNGPKGELNEEQRRLLTIFSERAAAAKQTAVQKSAASRSLRAANAVITNAGYPGCVDGLALGGHTRRIIVFAKDKNKAGGEIFELGYNTAGKEPGPEQVKIQPQAFPAQLDWESTGPASTQHICVARGEEEVWELRNTTNEVHNFHIHQGKFRLATRAEVEEVTEPGLLRHVCPGSSSDSACGSDPAKYIEQAHIDPIMSVQGHTGVLHDTFPIPPAKFDHGTMVTPGRVFVKVGFYAREQVGRYVYHCHILEHEDGGMMAPIEVIDTEERSAALPSLRHGIQEFFGRWRRKTESKVTMPGAAQ